MSLGSRVALVLVLTFSPFAKAKVANDYRVPQALSEAERARVYPIGNFKRARKFNTAGYKRFKVKDGVRSQTIEGRSKPHPLTNRPALTWLASSPSQVSPVWQSSSWSIYSASAHPRRENYCPVRDMTQTSPLCTPIRDTKPSSLSSISIRAWASSRNSVRIQGR